MWVGRAGKFRHLPFIKTALASAAEETIAHALFF